MKRVLALLSALLMVVTMTPMVFADNPYNDDLLDWGQHTEHVYSGCEDVSCNICGALRPAVEHTYNAVVTDPDCTNGGYTTYTCANCGDSYVVDQTGALGHQYDDEYDEYCNLCGEWREVEKPDVPDVPVVPGDCGHDGKREPTCEEEGYCPGCGVIYPALGHRFNDSGICEYCGEKQEIPDVPVDPGIPEDCHHEYDDENDEYCNLCGEWREVEKPECLHEWVEGVVTEPTCSSDGIYERYCILCYRREVERTPATGEHIYDDDFDSECNYCGEWREVETPDIPVEPECPHEYDDEYDEYCNLCGEWREVEKPDVPDVPVVPGDCDHAGKREPTCEEEGYCPGCGVIFAALGHRFNDSGICEYCGEKQEIPDVPVDPGIPEDCHHEYDDEYDEYCNLCGEWREVEKPECPHEYIYECSEECRLCGEIRETTHSVVPADCLSGSFCSKCYKLLSEPLGHKKGPGTNGEKNGCAGTLVIFYDCSRCSYPMGSEIVTVPVSHISDDGEITKEPTCATAGVKTYKCAYCGETLKTESIAKTSHTYTNACDRFCNSCGVARTAPHNYNAATCTKAKTCKNCGATSGEKLGHDYEKKITKATLTKDGVIKNVCKRCDYVASKTTAIYKASSIKLSKTSYTYNGKVQTPSVTVKDSKGNTLKKDTDYTVTYASGRKNAGTYKVTVKMKGKYSGTKELTYTIKGIDVSKCKISLSTTSYTYNGSAKKPAVTVKNASGTKLTTSSYTVTYASGRKNVGTYKVTIKMKGNYTGTKTLTFKINPVKTSISSLTAGTKKLTVKWSKKSTQVTGYEIQYSTSKSFKSVKTKTVSSYKTTSATLSSLKAKTTYYVRVRTYKTVNGKKYYSGWSTVKSLKTK